MLQSFDFIFHKGQTPIARLIKKMTNSEYSHVAMVIDPLHVLQSDWKTPVSIQHFSYPAGYYDVYRLKTALSDIERAKVILFMRDRLAAPYDWLLIFSRFFNILFGTRIVSSADRYNCDELIVDAFRHIGINLIDRDVPMTPDTLSKSRLIYKVEDVD